MDINEQGNLNEMDINQAVIAVDIGQNPELPLFDFYNTIPSDERSFSESGSITPSTIKGEHCTYPNVLAQKIDKSVEDQNIYLTSIIENPCTQQQRLLEEHQNLLRQFISEYNTLTEWDQGSSEPSQLDLNPINNLQKNINKLFEDINRLENKLLLLDNIKQNITNFAHEDNREVILVKLYQENKGIDNNASTEVKRFALIAEKLAHLINQPLTNNILHPLETILFGEAINSLLSEDGSSSGVVCDIFARKSNSIPATQEGTVETHSIVLWKELENGTPKLYLIDPSNPDFSSELIHPIINTYDINIEQDVEGQLYQAAKDQAIGREKNQARDCIDIAVKIVMELSYQTIAFPHKTITAKFMDTFMQISSNPDYAKHLLKNSNKQIREFTSTSDYLRHLVLQVARNSNPGCVNKKS